MTATATGFDEKIHRFSRMLNRADCILIGAGSGLSVDAGLDYFDKALFAKRYPAMLQYGYTISAQLMVFSTSAPELYWGYYLAHAKNMRFGEPYKTVYSRLLDIVGAQQDYFVITTNVDALFVRNGFSDNRIYTPQGDYALMQCRRPCRDDTWPSGPIIDRLLPTVDPLTQKLPKALVPVCPNCGGPVFFNLRGGNWFVDAPYTAQRRRYQTWIERNQKRRILLIEIGTGFNTPVWIRWPFEELTLQNPNANLVRINLEESDIPENIRKRSLGFSNRAIDVVSAVWNHLKIKEVW
ncbi:MAG: hypothetical protein P8X96_06285 [Desulfobacteraceae bacterium]